MSLRIRREHSLRTDAGAICRRSELRSYLTSGSPRCEWGKASPPSVALETAGAARMPLRCAITHNPNHSCAFKSITRLSAQSNRVVLSRFRHYAEQDGSQSLQVHMDEQPA